MKINNNLLLKIFCAKILFHITVLYIILVKYEWLMERVPLSKQEVRFVSQQGVLSGNWG